MPCTDAIRRWNEVFEHETRLEMEDGVLGILEGELELVNAKIELQADSLHRRETIVNLILEVTQRRATFDYDLDHADGNLDHADDGWESTDVDSDRAE